MSVLAHNNLRAELPAKPAQNARMLDNKEQIEKWQLVVHCPESPNYGGSPFKIPVTVRVWMGRSANASTVYAAIWISGDDFWTSGKGQAGGYGYCKTSSAIADAIRSAGVKLYGSAYSVHHEALDMTKEAHIGGTGMNAVESALLAIGEALGYNRDSMIVVK